MKSPKLTMPEALRRFEVETARAAVTRLTEVEAPNHTEAKVVNDVINMCHVFVTHNGGKWRGAVGSGMKVVTLADDDGLIHECIRFFGSLAWAAIESNGNINVSAEQGAMLLDLVDVYEEIVGVLPEAEVEKTKNMVKQYYKSLGPLRAKILKDKEQTNGK